MNLFKWLYGSKKPESDAGVRHWTSKTEIAPRIPRSGLVLTKPTGRKLNADITHKVGRKDDRMAPLRKSRWELVSKPLPAEGRIKERSLGTLRDLKARHTPTRRHPATLITLIYGEINSRGHIRQSHGLL